jgi:hypothetical protein
MAGGRPRQAVAVVGQAQAAGVEEALGVVAGHGALGGHDEGVGQHRRQGRVGLGQERMAGSHGEHQGFHVEQLVLDRVPSHRRKPVSSSSGWIPALAG